MSISTSSTGVPPHRAANWLASAVAVVTVSLVGFDAQPRAQTPSFPKAPLTYPTPIDPDDIGGVVASLQGNEAGVWVIAEASDLAKRFVRIVLTDDEGRYVLPDLPKGSYQVFVRGYGLNDSKRQKAWPGQQVFFGVTTPTPPDAAKPKPRPGGVERNLMITMWDDDGSLNGQNASSGDAPTVESTTSGHLTTVRVPYPEEFVARVVEERVDDEKAGWKGRGYWATSLGKVLKFQVRPNPLAR